VTLTAWWWPEPEHALPPWKRPQTHILAGSFLQHPGLSAMKPQPDTQDPFSCLATPGSRINAITTTGLLSSDGPHEAVAGLLVLAAAAAVPPRRRPGHDLAPGLDLGSGLARGKPGRSRRGTLGTRGRAR
jgi:hypothetical protein